MAKPVSTLIKYAIQAGKNRNYKTAIRILEDLASKGLAETSSPFKNNGIHYPEIYLYLARSWTALQNYSKAIFYAKSYMDSSSLTEINRAEGFFFLGRAYYASKQYEKAVYCFEKALNANYKKIETMAMLAASYLKWKKPHIARSLFEKALYLAPDNQKLNTGYLNSLLIEGIYELKVGNADTASQMFSFVIKNGINTVLSNLYLAHSFKMQGLFEKALIQYQTVCAMQPNDMSLKWYPAIIKIQMGNLKEAIADFKVLGFEIPSSELSEKAFALGIIKNYFDLNQLSKAALASRLFMQAFGNNADICILAAEIHHRMGKIDTALKLYKCAMEKEPKNPYPHYGLFLTLQSSYRWRQLKNAILHAEKAGVCDKNDIYYYKVLTASHLDTSPHKILPHLHALLKSGKVDTALFNAVGCTYVKLNLPDLALRWYKKTLLLNNNDEEALIGIIACYEALQLNDKANSAYIAYLKKWSNNICIRRDYILFLKGCGKWEKAACQLEKLMEMCPKKNFEAELGFT